jgi:aryl-alcohol dehydrogenase-like predicted oxidoreductase
MKDGAPRAALVPGFPVSIVSVLEGRATVDATSAFRDRGVRDRRLPPGHFRRGPGGELLSSIGLGTYIGSPDGPTDLAVEDAATICLTSSRVNVLDTAINYRHQRAERSLGRALARVTGAGDVDRRQVFVATKNGYFAPDGESKLSPNDWISRELIRSGVLDPADIVDGCHAMSRSYLADQVSRSLRNLGVATIDLLYLHNAPDAQLPAVGRAEFLARLETAFRLYEELRDAGQVAAYGLATWESLRTRPGSPSYLDLESALRVARAVGGDNHGFRYLQFPFNLAMPEAATLRNQPVNGTRHTLFDAAAHLGLGCFTSVPLVQGQLARTGPKQGKLSPAQTAIQFARSAPGTLGPLVGQKRPEHVSENLALAATPPWGIEEFRALLA